MLYYFMKLLTSAENINLGDLLMSEQIFGKLDNLLKSDSVLNQLSRTQLINEILANREGVLTESGAVRTETGKYTGRSPKDKFIVEEEETKDQIDWGTINQPISEDIFLKLLDRVLDYLGTKDKVYKFNGYAGADPATQLNLRVINELAWHNLFARTMFIRPETFNEGILIDPDFTIISAPHFKADPKIDGTNSETFIITSFKHNIILIGGTEYAGEMKKGIFGVMNYLLPTQDVMSMHCSANVGENKDVALFFGLSGTGKTTLSADPHRKLIGDDEHGWNDNGIFNIEGGCYAKTIDLSHEKEPQIYDAIRYGAILENVKVDEKGFPDYEDKSLTENTRAAYPIENIDNIVLPSIAGHAKTIIFLTADAFGVLPPISKLTKEQAMYHFLSGFTSKLAGTERGVTSPQPVFSTCFGSPFLPLHATVYANMLGALIDKHDSDVYLVNTGWTGGEYGVGSRMSLTHTRSMIRRAISGEIKNSEFTQDPIFGLYVPNSVAGVPKEILMPRNAWVSQDAYDEKAKDLALRFQENFKKFGEKSAEIEEKGGFIFRG